MTADVWQACPLCKGTGHTVSFALGEGGTAVKSEVTCTLCLGEKVIGTRDGLPPSMQIKPDVEPTPKQAGDSFLEGFLAAVNEIAEKLKK